MSKSDVERLKKIIHTWDAAEAQILSRGITREMLLEDEFSQWALTTPLYNIGEQVYKLSSEMKASYGSTQPAPATTRRRDHHNRQPRSKDPE